MLKNLFTFNSKKMPKAFLISLGLIIALSFLGDYIVSNGLKLSKHKFYSEWNDIYDGEVKADLVIQGSSIAWVHVSPKIIDSILGTTSYNLGMNGYFPLMQGVRYKIYRQWNAKPKIILQMVGSGTLKKREDLHRIQQFFPYFDDPLIKEITREYEGFSWFDYHLPLYRYRGSRKLFFDGVFNFFKINCCQSNAKFKGYEGQEKTWDNLLEKYRANHSEGITLEIHEETIKALDEFLASCKRDNIEVFLIYPPEYYEFQELLLNKNEVVNFYRDFAKKYSLVFLNYSEDPISYNKSLFYNSQHLNKEGSELFSLKLAKDLKPYLELPNTGE